MGQGKIKLIIQGVDEFSKTLNGMTKKLNSISDLTDKIGKGMTLGLTAPIVGFGVASLKASMDFNKLMANVGSLIPNNISRVNELKDSVLKLSNETGVSTELISKGLYDMISAFGDTADTSKIMEINVKASTAGLATMQDAIALTSAVTKGYNDTSAKAVEKASDLAFMTVRLGQTTFPELAQSIGRVTPLANALGVSQEELFGVFAAATGVTGKATDVSTQFRGTLQALLAPSKKMKELMTSLGFANGQAMIKQLGMKGSLDMIVGTAKKANLPLQELVGSIEGQTIALALAGNSSQDFTNKLAEMGKAQGSMKQAFKDQTAGVNKAGHGFTMLMTRLTNFASRVGDVLAPVFLSLLDSLEPFMNTLQSLSPTLIKIGAIFGAVLAVIGPILIVVSQLISAFTAISGFLATFGGLQAIIIAIGSALATIGWPITIIIGLLLLLYKFWQPVSAFFMGTLNGIKKAFEPIMKQLSPIIASFKEFGTMLWAMMEPIGLTSDGFAKAMSAGEMFGKVLLWSFEPVMLLIEGILAGINGIGAAAGWLGETLGLQSDTNENMPQAGMIPEASARINRQIANQNKSSFNGTMTFANAPKGSSLQVSDNSAGMDVGFENGYVFAP